MQKRLTEFVRNGKRWEFTSEIGTDEMAIRVRDASTGVLMEWHDCAAYETLELFHHLEAMYKDYADAVAASNVREAE